MRFNQSGDSLWSNYYGDTLTDFGNDIALFSDGKLGITGRREIEGSSPAVAVLKVDSLGIIDFDTNWSAGGFPIGEGKKVFELSNSRFGVAGSVTIHDNNEDMYLAYSYPNLHLFHKGKSIGTNDNDWGSSAVALGAQGFAVVGHSIGYDNAFKNIVIVKTDTLINTEFPKKFLHNEDSISVTGLPDNNYISSRIKYNSFAQIITNVSPNIAQYHIVDVLGKGVLSGTFTSELILGDLTLNSGLYVVIVQAEGKYWTSKIIIP